MPSHLKGQVIRATFSLNLSRKIVALQARTQLVTQQISVVQVAAHVRKSRVVIGQRCVLCQQNKIADALAFLRKRGTAPLVKDYQWTKKVKTTQKKPKGLHNRVGCFAGREGLYH